MVRLYRDLFEVNNFLSSGLVSSSGVTYDSDEFIDAMSSFRYSREVRRSERKFYWIQSSIEVCVLLLTLQFCNERNNLFCLSHIGTTVK